MAAIPLNLFQVVGLSIFFIAAYVWFSPLEFFPSLNDSTASVHLYQMGDWGPSEDSAMRDPQDFVNALRKIYRPESSLNQGNFTDFDGNTHHLIDSPLWNKPLGKDICIVDFDNRPLDGPNELFSPSRFQWQKSDDGSLSNGILNHYLYSMIHGYSYHFVRTPEFPDRFASWAKPGVIAEHLSKCRFVIFVDSDIVFRHLSLPMEWLLNRWNITASTAIAAPLDPNTLDSQDVPLSRDSHGRTNHNTGFMIVQQGTRASAIMRSWATCTDNKVAFDGCAEWANKWPFDQGAFNEYIRYAFDKPDDIVGLPCAEANGYPDSTTQCEGTFIRHFWRKRYLLKHGVEDSIVQVIAQMALSNLRTSGYA